MTENNHNKIDESISALSRATESLMRRTEGVDKLINELRGQRRSYIAKTVAGLLPDISGKVLDSLRKNVPFFVTNAIQESFATNKKKFGFFEGKGYQNALFLLQAQLSSYLDSIKYGELKELYVDISRLIDEKTSINTKSKEIWELLNLLQKARRSNAILPKEVDDQLNYINSKASQAGDVRMQSRGVSSPYSNAGSQSNVSRSYIVEDDDSDIWFYLLTDMPISFRTLLIDAIADDRKQDISIQDDNESQSTIIDDREYDDSSRSYVDNDSYDYNMSDGGSIDTGLAGAVLAGVAGMAIGAVAEEVVGTIAGESIAIATDDSLGYFS